ncbi:tRNA-dihydrouridine synthase [Candidatus Shapirobacteria bacterium]|nr:tRNA-dihydrouridine synthase [Candidatus Shapirobacteria bacterium]
MDLRQLINSKFVIGLAPMDGVTDEAYRQTQCHIYKPDVIFTEFTSAEGISRGGVKLYDELLYSANERPIIGQIFGKDPESFYKSAIILTHLGFDGIDINMGCPAKNVTQHGSGAALIGKPELASELIESVRQGINDYCEGKVGINDIGLKKSTLDVIDRNLKYSGLTPSLSKRGQGEILIPTLSLKTRLGIDSDVSDTWIPHVLKHKLDFMTLHGRTLRQGYSGLSNWESISRAAMIAKELHTPFWGNGDVTNISQAQDYGTKYGVTGILIGRSSMGNPWIFTDHLPTWTEKFAVMKYHTQKFIEVYPERRLDPLRHHFILFVSGHPRAAELRQKVIRIESFEQLCALEPDFINC